MQANILCIVERTGHYILFLNISLTNQNIVRQDLLRDYHTCVISKKKGIVVVVSNGMGIGSILSKKELLADVAHYSPDTYVI